MQMNSFSSNDVLAAAQAQVVYLIMRVVDEATEPAELNVVMLRAFEVGFPGSV